MMADYTSARYNYLNDCPCGAQTPRGVTKALGGASMSKILTRKVVGIYKITNLVNGKTYVGQSVDIYSRWKSHRHEGKQNHNAYLHRSIHKYGLGNFSFEIIERCSVDLLDELEKKYIRKLGCIAPNGYNMDLGGCVRKELGEETRKKRARFGKQNGNYGKPKSAWFKKLVAAARSKPINQYTFEGKYIATFPNARSVPGLENGYSAIGMCCRGAIKSAYGYQWRFASEDDGNVGPVKYDYSNLKHRTVKVSQYTVDGKYITTHNSLVGAGKNTGANPCSIQSVCAGRRKTAGGFVWRYADGSDD